MTMSLNAQDLTTAKAVARSTESRNALWLFAAMGLLVVAVGGATFLWGLGALILSGVAATFLMLGLLVVMTAGG
ncbi:hypothetical protein [Phaeovulum sp. W22_SRMD_FR3]|uniref:hypothetical protein n=1 Tax=Phaeovulum sp. W22_SRMD_FR3 TaxID=3240274 RepID=UPI003F944B15